MSEQTGANISPGGAVPSTSESSFGTPSPPGAVAPVTIQVPAAPPIARPSVAPPPIAPPPPAAAIAAPAPPRAPANPVVAAPPNLGGMVPAPRVGAQQPQGIPNPAIVAVRAEPAPPNPAPPPAAVPPPAQPVVPANVAAAAAVQQVVGAAPNVAPGMQNNILPLNDDADDAEPSGRGWVSSLSWVARSAISTAGQEELKIDFKAMPPVHGDKGVKAASAEPIMKTDGWAIRSEVIRRRLNGSGVFLWDQVLLGTRKGVARVRRPLRIHLERHDREIAILDGHYNEKRFELTITPAFAAAFNGVLTTEVFNVRRNLSTLFNDPQINQVDVASVCAHGRALKYGGVEPTRFLWRLASLYVESLASGADPSNRVTWGITADFPLSLDSCSWLQWRGAMRTDQHGQYGANYIPWYNRTGGEHGFSGICYRVIYLAGSGRVALYMPDRAIVPTSWPQIRHTAVVTNHVPAAVADNDNLIRLSADEIDIVAKQWAFRYASLERYQAILKTVLMLHWRRAGGTQRLIGLGWNDALTLPPAEMRGYLLLPYLHDIGMGASEAEMPADGLGAARHYESLAESMSASLLLNFCKGSVHWRLTRSVLSRVEANDQDVFNFEQITHAFGANTPIWAVVNQYARGLGYGDFDVGCFISSLHTLDAVPLHRVMATWHYNNHYTSAQMAGLLKTLPAGCSLQGLLHPEPLKLDLAKARQTVLFSDAVRAGCSKATLAGLFEVQGTSFQMITQGRFGPDIRTAMVATPRRDETGTAVDDPFLAFTDQNGSRIRYAFILDFTAAQVVGGADHDRYTMQWWLMEGERGTPARVSELPGCYASLPPQLPPEGWHDVEINRQRRQQPPREDRLPPQNPAAAAVPGPLPLPTVGARSTQGPAESVRDYHGGVRADVCVPSAIMPSGLGNISLQPLYCPSDLMGDEQTYQPQNTDIHTRRALLPGVEQQLESWAVRNAHDPKLVAAFRRTAQEWMEGVDRDYELFFSVIGSKPELAAKPGSKPAKALPVTCGVAAGSTKTRRRKDGDDDDEDDQDPSQGGARERTRRTSDAGRTTGGATGRSASPGKPRRGRTTSGKGKQAAGLHVGEEPQTPANRPEIQRSPEVAVRVQVSIRNKNAMSNGESFLLMSDEEWEEYSQVAREREACRLSVSLGSTRDLDKTAMDEMLRSDNLHEERGLEEVRQLAGEVKQQAAKLCQRVSFSRKFVENESRFLQELQSASRRLLVPGGSAMIEDALEKREFCEEATQALRLESVYYWEEVMQAVKEQRLGAAFSARVGIPTLPIEATMIEECDCILKTWTSAERRLRVTTYGACPRVLVRLFGGRWCNKEDPRALPCRHVPLAAVFWRQWFSTLRLKARARYLCFARPSVAGTEHYQLLGATVSGAPACVMQQRLQEIGAQVDAHVSLDDDRSGDQLFTWMGDLIHRVYPNDCVYVSPMPRRKPKGGSPITITCRMVLRAMPGIKALMELLHNRCPESDESEIAGTTVALGCSGPRIFEAIVRAGWLEVPLRDWWQKIKQPLVDIRRTLTFQGITGAELLKLRKILNVTIRVTGNSDIASENYNRGQQVTRKALYGWRAYENAGTSTFMAYESLFLRKAHEVIGAAVNAMPEDIRIKKVSDFWGERCLRGASGASKAIRKVDLAAMVGELAPMDRPGKRALVEALPAQALHAFLREKPTDRAYYFVKPEPGRKLRSLYASYDEEAFISAYANQSIENYMGRWPGIMVRQTPADVVSWMNASEGGLGGQEAYKAYWVSSDYSDYNSEHTLWEMSTLDSVFGEELLARSGDNALEKATASWWIAASRANSAIIYGKTSEQPPGTAVLHHPEHGWYLPVVNGLYSGSRTTARDNTWIHAIDLEIAKHCMQEFGLPEEMQWTAVCGDDEDVAFASMTGAMMYAGTLASVGHKINPVKQLAGSEFHEFLQLTWSTTARVEKPLCSLLATLATGNWYVQGGIWLQTAISGTVANYWELFNRGAPLQVCRRLAAETLDELMRTKDPLSTETNPIYRALEWASFCAHASLPPLFYGIGGVNQPPRYEAVAEPTEAWPSKASRDYVARHTRMLNFLPRRIRGEFIDHMQQSTVGACLKTWQQREAKRWCAIHWPAKEWDLRVDIEQKPDWSVCVRDKIDLAQWQFGMPDARDCLTEEAVCGRMGVPFFLARKLGGLKNLGPYVNTEAWAKYTEVSDMYYPLSAQAYCFQPNIRAVASWSRVPLPGVHAPTQRRRPRKLLYVYMANGAGKTHLAKVIRGVQDLDAVWLDKYGAIRERYIEAKQRSEFSQVLNTTSELLDVAVGRGSMLLGQLDPAVIKTAAERVGIEIKLATYDPGREVRRTRLLARGWSPDKIESLLTRGDKYYGWALENKIHASATFGELLMLAQNAGQWPERLVDAVDAAKYRQKTDYVFDRTEAVTRKLEIQETQALRSLVSVA